MRAEIPLVRAGLRPGFEQKNVDWVCDQIDDLLKTFDKVCESREAARPNLVCDFSAQNLMAAPIQGAPKK